MIWNTSPLLLLLLLHAMLLVLGLVGIVYGVREFARRQSTPGPQKARLVAKIALGPTVLGILFMLLLGQLAPATRTLSYLMAVPLGIIAMRYAWIALREPDEADAVANFAHDREHCGRCGYSVTGNVTGTCPECGWTFPAGELPTEEPDWSAWWRKWRIRYVRDYVWHLTSYVGIGLYCFVLGAYFWSEGNAAAAVVIVLLGAHLCVNAIRVAQYLLSRRRHAAATPPT